jgi:DNA-directed RNA polymerase specialized sigma24 family protein
VNEKFKNSLSDEDYQEQLKKLAIEAQKHPPLSRQRQLVLSMLVSKIWHSPNLAHPQKHLWSPSLYEDFYNEALQKTMLETCQKIDSYNSEYSVMAWVNFRLNKHFIGVVSDRYKQGVTYLSRTEKRTFSFLSLDELEREIPDEETINEAVLLRQFLVEDPENRLKTEFIEGYPQATFQFIALAKFVEDRTWTDIATDLEISLQTLYSFFYRRLQKLMPYFRKYLQE